ncbi:tetratricopeptide repeat protein [Anseongella ginsenosidimutans]|uniref:type IX secretion system periplasmic lipoprotein PorW/SprE n=1 Tax=Anseongella ginsenosidimutans TaxID=496056 RepID=UPI001045570D|nr:tetratricopeptide repeat protein [Anseongella ginsenosidimutans]QEC51178.1 tetratricopeptide repeat protein [Anseongella ginsenosidimutans]
MQLTDLKRFAGIILPVALLVLVSSCRSSRTNDAGFFKRAYHNITARYNGYFNAKQLYGETINAFEQGYIDSYDQLLPVIRVPGESQSQDLAASMGSVISKASEMIDRHEISRWTDDAYLLIGKANFYRYDLDNALLSLQYVYNEYEDNDIRQEALAWIGLSNLLKERYQDAETAFDIALSNIDSSASAAPFVYAAAAWFNIQRDNLNLAVPLLKKAGETVREREAAIRYAYITGQLYERMGQPDSAVTYYSRVIELKPDYEIIFNTRLSIARLYNVTAPGGEGIEQELWEMMEDEKNKDYIDQLYYVLGTIAEKKGNIPEAINYYTLSARTSTLNKNQKGVAYLGIAEIWFRAGDYDKARQYYDSTMTSLSANYPGYDQVLYKSGKLKALSENTRIIQREDSLQRLALIPAGERMKIVDRLVKELLAKKAEEQKLATQALSSGFSRGQGSSLVGRVGAGSWYFYNTTALSQGYSEFLRRWSNRPNESNWRRSNKQSLAGVEPDVSVSPGEQERAAANDPEALREALLAGIPFEPDQLDSSNYRIISAYYEMAGIYENDLLSPAEAIRYYEELMERYPGNKHSPSVYYSLYKLYQGIDPAKSETYKNIVLTEYPESDYALVINNPGSVLARAEQTDSRLGPFYEETYRLFQEGQYAEVISRCQAPEVSRTTPTLAAKFALLHALAVGRTDSIPQFTASLERVSTSFSEEEPGRRARAWLTYVQTHPDEFSGRMPALLEGGSWLTDFDAIQRRMAERARREAAALARAREEAERNSYFKIPGPSEPFVVVIAVNDPSLNLNSTRFGLGQLNRRLYEGKNYQHQVKTVNNETQLLSVGSFADMQAARDYYETLLQHRGALIKAPEEKTSVFYLTASNFERLVNAGTVRDYRYYFRVNFLSGKAGRQAAAETRTLPEESTAPGADSLAAEEAGLPEASSLPGADSLAAAPPVTSAAEEAGLPEEGSLPEADKEPGTDSLAASPSGAVPSEEAVPAGNAPEETPAEAVKEALAEAAEETPAETPAAGAVSSRFSPEAEDAKYLLVVAVNDAEMNLNSTRLGIGLFNRGYYNRMDYKHNSKKVNNETQLISVTIFSSRQEAEAYYQAFMNRREQIVKAPDAKTDIFLITRDNFLLLDSQQIVNEYVNYFNNNYRRADE